MNTKKNSKVNYFLPFIMFFVAVIYIFQIIANSNNISISLAILLTSPGIIAIVCSIASIIVIWKYKANINRYIPWYILTTVIGATITVVTIPFFSPLAVAIIMPFIMITESGILTLKTDYPEEIVAWILINPVYHIQLVLLCMYIAMLVTDYHPLHGL